jgi:hypothetical protein
MLCYEALVLLSCSIRSNKIFNASFTSTIQFANSVRQFTSTNKSFPTPLQQTPTCSIYIALSPPVRLSHSLHPRRIHNIYTSENVFSHFSTASRGPRNGCTSPSRHVCQSCWERFHRRQLRYWNVWRLLLGERMFRLWRREVSLWRSVRMYMRIYMPNPLLHLSVVCDGLGGK